MFQQYATLCPLPDWGPIYCAAARRITTQLAANGENLRFCLVKNCFSRFSRDFRCFYPTIYCTYESIRLCERDRVVSMFLALIIAQVCWNDYSIGWTEYWDGYRSIQLVKACPLIPIMSRKRFAVKNWEQQIEKLTFPPNSEVNNAVAQQRPAARFMSKCAMKDGKLDPDEAFCVDSETEKLLQVFSEKSSFLYFPTSCFNCIYLKGV